MELSGISTDDILDFIFEEIGGCNYDEIDEIFNEININNMEVVNILCLLTITYTTRKKYKNREKFYFDAKTHLKTIMSVEEVDELLHGFND